LQINKKYLDFATLSKKKRSLGWKLTLLEQVEEGLGWRCRDGG
jgi:hypothetical protein